MMMKGEWPRVTVSRPAGSPGTSRGRGTVIVEAAGGLSLGGRELGVSERVRLMSGRETPPVFLLLGFDIERAPARARDCGFPSGETVSEFSLSMSSFSSAAVA